MHRARRWARTWRGDLPYVSGVFRNYIDWSVRCAHYKLDGTSVDLSNTKPIQVRVTQHGDQWRQQVIDAESQ